MSAVQLLAAAVLVLSVGALAGAIVIIGLLRRVRTLEAESSTAAQVRFARAILEGRESHQPRPATSHVNERTTPPTLIAPTFSQFGALPVVEPLGPTYRRQGPWDGSGYQA